MLRHSALAFTVTRSDDQFGTGGIRSTTERVHGLLRIDGGTLVIQWRMATQTDEYGAVTQTVEQIGALREATLPLTAIATVAVRRPWPRWWRKPRLVLTAADLSAFEALVGPEGLERAHPAELTLVLRRGDRLAAEEFAADLALAIAERGLGEGSRPAALP